MSLIIFFLSPTSSTLKVLSAPSTSWQCSHLSVFVTSLCKSSRASGSAGKCRDRGSRWSKAPIQRTLWLRSLQAHFGPLPLFPGRWRTRGILKKETGFQTPTGSPQPFTGTWHRTAAGRMQKEQRGRGSFPLFVFPPLK